MSKYNLDIKLKIIKEYEHKSLKNIADKYNISVCTISNWIRWYNDRGIDGLKNSISHKKYTGEFKLSVIQYRKIYQCSLRETAIKFNLPNESMICSWEKRYLEKGLDGLNSKKGRPYKNMSKNKNISEKKSLNETEREELIRLREENMYLKMKAIYEKKLSALLLEKELKVRKKP